MSDSSNGLINRIIDEMVLIKQCRLKDSPAVTPQRNDYHFKLLLTKQEMDELKHKAQSTGESLEEYIRRKLFNQYND
jgi:hypothetical protein